MNKQQKMIVVAAIAVVAVFIVLKPVLFPVEEENAEFETTVNPKQVYEQALQDKKQIFLEFYSPG